MVEQLSTIKDLATIIIDGDWIESDNQSESGIRLIQTGNIGCGVYLDKNLRAKFISEDTFERLKCTEVFPGDILISRLPDPVGRSCIVPAGLGKMITAVDCTIFRINQELCLPKYFVYSTQSEHYNNEIKRFITGTTRDRISRKNLEKIKIKLPKKISDQQHIVKVLDAITSIIEKRKQQIALLEEAEKSLFVEMFGDPVTNPMGWEKVSLKDLAIKITNGTTPKGGKEVYVDKGITFFRSQNVWWNRFDMGDIAYLDEETHQKMKESALKYGDILITKTGRFNTENSSLGRSALYLGKDNAANINGHVYLVRLSQEKVLNRFVLQILISDAFRKLIRTVCVGGIDKRQLNKNHIEDFPIIIPPIDLQMKYVSSIEDIENNIQTLKTGLRKLNQMKSALMQQYFG